VLIFDRQVITNEHRKAEVVGVGSFRPRAFFVAAFVTSAVVSGDSMSPPALQATETAAAVVASGAS
jgi:hypothetical protein